MKIYKVKCLINFKSKNNKRIKEYEREIIIIDNLDSAKLMYHNQIVMCHKYKDLIGYSGSCELFEPYICSDGHLDNYPDNYPDDNSYIEQFIF